ncbi:MAG: PaaI family thioesterase [Candidatus Auribacter fodinae]|jgi:uncharacterized protein (TIGR00369 family)|uniref:PaaI family thioesterase n=1 Tax=Candidatus Auribacter fodinae TaxID=2093366 RepID=A0A3A4R103_9BACT|nr:MAG: PaaI family thioesterase [Candidatus Auribacter fodinae]
MKQRLPSFDFCFCCGEKNSFGLNIPFFAVENGVQAVFTPAGRHAGYPGIMHGGLTATVLDEAMTWAATIGTGRFHYAADINVRYKAPVPHGEEITVTATIVETIKKIIVVDGEIRDSNNKVLAKSVGKYYPLPESDDLTIKSMMRHYDNGYSLS